MVEGHGTHRVAALHRRFLVGKRFQATSPNGRFTEGAAAIDGKVLTKAECIGKNLLYSFASTEKADPEVVVHVHFGMSGRFSTHKLPGPASGPTTRLRLLHAASSTVALCSAMTLQHGSPELLARKAAELGPDPLREDADPERLWKAMQKTTKPVGLVLMDQSCVAGVGNIYRAEILYKAGVHPELPANTVTRDQFQRLWFHTVDLMQRGFVTGSILTVDASEGLPAPWTRRYIYNQSRCGRCGDAVRTWDMATRTVYCCETCQQLPSKVQLSEARVQAMSGAGPARLFQSHCAPDGADTLLPAKMSVAQLRVALQAKGVHPGAKTKAQMVALLQSLAGNAEDKAEMPKATVCVKIHAPALDGIRPGTAHLLMDMASAEDAAMEKALAGESGAVEHVALADDATDAVRVAARKRRAERPALDTTAPRGVLPFTQRKRGNAGAL